MGRRLAGQQRRLGGVFFGSLLLGLRLMRDCGISVGERQNCRTGRASLRHGSEKVRPSLIANHADFANNRIADDPARAATTCARTTATRRPIMTAQWRHKCGAGAACSGFLFSG